MPTTLTPPMMRSVEDFKAALTDARDCSAIVYEAREKRAGFFERERFSGESNRLM